MYLTIEELSAKAQMVSNFGAVVTITGLWAWAKFADKPSEEIRTELKKSGWKWSKLKAMWYLPGKPCGSKKNHDYYYIVEKYGEEEVKPTVPALRAFTMAIMFVIGGYSVQSVYTLQTDYLDARTVYSDTGYTVNY